MHPKEQGIRVVLVVERFQEGDILKHPLTLDLDYEMIEPTADWEEAFPPFSASKAEWIDKAEAQSIIEAAQQIYQLDQVKQTARSFNPIELMTTQGAIKLFPDDLLYGKKKKTWTRVGLRGGRVDCLISFNQFLNLFRPLGWMQINEKCILNTIAMTKKYHKGTLTITTGQRLNIDRTFRPQVKKWIADL